MRVGYGELFPGEGPTANAHFVKLVAQTLEELQFSSLWVGEHLVFFPETAEQYPNGKWGQRDVESLKGLFDPYVLLGAAAMVTSKLRLGLGISLIAERNPIITAREVSTIDRLSNGRIMFGVGLGWSRTEYEAVGVPWARRGRRVDEYLEVMRELWTSDLSSFSGEFVNFGPLYLYPKPIQQPIPPVYIGGNGEAAVRRILRHENAGWYGSNLEIDQVEQFVAMLERHLHEVGRQRSDVDLIVARRTPGSDEAAWLGDRNFVDACEALGIDEVVCRPRLGQHFEEKIEDYAEIIGVTDRAASHNRAKEGK